MCSTKIKKTSAAQAHASRLHHMVILRSQNNVSCEEGAFIKRPPCHHLWPPILLRDLKTTITFFSVEPAELS